MKPVVIILLGAIAAAASVGAAAAEDAAAGEQVFNKCKTCHQVGERRPQQGRARPERNRRPKGGNLSRLQLFRREQELGHHLG